jgi:hypothetical protein
MLKSSPPVRFGGEQAQKQVWSAIHQEEPILRLRDDGQVVIVDPGDKRLACEMILTPLTSIYFKFCVLDGWIDWAFAAAT